MLKTIRVTDVSAIYEENPLLTIDQGRQGVIDIFSPLRPHDHYLLESVLSYSPPDYDSNHGRSDLRQKTKDSGLR